MTSTSSLQQLSVIFAGSGEFGVPTLRALVGAGVEVVRVYTQPDRPAGRGRALTPTPLAEAAEGLGLSVVRTPDINRETLPAADMMVVIAFGQKIAPHQVDHPRLGSINLHASRLPRYRGAAPINWAIIRGETITGNSAIRLAERMDAGAILAQSQVAIGPVETAGELHDRLAADGPELMLPLLAQLQDGSAVETVQDESLATIAPKLSRKAGAIDFRLPPEETSRLIRGLHPWPGCRVKLCDAGGLSLSTLRLVRAAPGEADDSDRWEPGELTLDGLVRSGSGVIELWEVQPDGKRPMSLAEYRRGNPWMPGMRLVAAEE